VNEAEVRKKLLEILRKIAPEVDLDSLDPGKSLRTQADLDSVSILQLVVAIHGELGVDVPETEYRELETLERAVAYLTPRVGSG
jgi:acyl carrier protein